MSLLPTAIHLEMTQKGFFLGPSMFHIIINDLGDSTWNMLIKFGGDTKLRSTGSAQESRIKIQNDSDKSHLCPQKGGEKKEKKKRCYSNRVMCKMFTQSGITATKPRTSSSSIENLQERLHGLLHITGGTRATSVTQLPQRQENPAAARRACPPSWQGLSFSTLGFVLALHVQKMGTT